MEQIETLYHHFKASAGVATDSRVDVTDCLFFALSGANFDGHDFVPAVLDKGAYRAVVSSVVKGYEEQCIVVPDVLHALQELARFYRQQLSATVIGITGSNGKTTTKELMVRVLQSGYKTHATPGNFNNLIGLPLTILSCPVDCEVLVLEMGSNAFGEIAQLCAIGQPDMGLITNIGDAHLEGFENRNGVLKEKTALYRSVAGRGGTLFVNERDEVLKEAARELTKTTYYGIQSEDPLKLCSTYLNLTQLVPNIKGQLIVNGAESEICLELPGAHNAINCAAAAAVGALLGVSSEYIANALESYTARNNRTQIIRDENRNLTIILDAYNANPISVNRALDMLDEWPVTKKIAILGAMKELGSESAAAHQKLFDRLESSDYHSYYLVGREMQSISQQAFESTSQLGDHMEEDPDVWTEAVVLIKGSRSVGLEKLLTRLGVDVK